MNTPTYMRPLDALVADTVDTLDAELREDFEERAGIMEHDGRLARAHAECLALVDLMLRRPACFTGLLAVEIELDGGTQWLLTSDLDFARQHLAVLGASEIAVLEAAEVVREQYGDLAMLCMPG